MQVQTSAGSALKSLRLESGLTQGEVGERSGVSPSRLSEYENDKREPGLGVLSRILATLRVDLVDLGIAMGMTGRRPSTREEIKRLAEQSHDAPRAAGAEDGDDPEVDLVVEKVLRRLEALAEERSADEAEEQVKVRNGVDD